MNQYHIQDARSLSNTVSKQVDVIITSPPYFDMKDYGSLNQIGYGQEYSAYLEDMRKVLEQCYAVSKDSGCLWMIVDTLKKDKAYKLLPFDLADEAKKSGWILQDIIIWKKDRTLPFARRGETRNIFEYILYFVKSENFKYYPERISSLDIKEWWIKYPERYGLNGKSLSDVWEFPIPVQGSWGQSYVRHFCPLPPQMIDQIIRLCSDEGDVVFDPFAGSGAVLAEAHKLKRNFIGCDLNPNYREMFYDYLSTVVIEDPAQKEAAMKELLGRTLLDLRILKWPSALLKAYKKDHPELFSHIQGILIHPLSISKTDATVNYSVVLDEDMPIINEQLSQYAQRAPLTKYGVKATLIFSTQLTNIPSWEYSWAATHNAPKKFEGESYPFIGSSLRLDVHQRRLVDNYIKKGKLVM